jgi:hypothetical protein
MLASNFYIALTLKHDPQCFADILNEMADYLEARKPVPDHWDADKRQQFYEQVATRLTLSAITMLAKLEDTSL